MLGLLLAAVEKAAALVFPPALTAALLVAVSAVATRGLHLDGLMDVCDGLFGGYTPERRLEIMRDSHVGAFAVLGASCLLLLKYGALVALLSQDVLEPAWALVLYPVLSRWAMVLQLGAFPYTRSSGLGSLLHQGGGRIPTVLAGVTAVLVSAAAGGIGGGILLAGSSLLAWLLGAGMARMLGGLTGATYGATNEIIEAATIIAVVGLLPLGIMEPPPLLPLLPGWGPS